MTRYVVLRGRNNAFSVIGQADASSPAGAIRQLAKDFAETTGDDLSEFTFAAVPLRSWRPKPIELEVQTRLKIG